VDLEHAGHFGLGFALHDDPLVDEVVVAGGGPGGGGGGGRAGHGWTPGKLDFRLQNSDFRFAECGNLLKLCPVLYAEEWTSLVHFSQGEKRFFEIVLGWRKQMGELTTKLTKDTKEAEGSSHATTADHDFVAVPGRCPTRMKHGPA